MSHVEKDANTTNQAEDELVAIYGIGPTFARALNQIGIHRYSELACYTPAELSQALLDQTGMKVPTERIEAKDWIGQARKLAQESSPDEPLNADKTKTTEAAGDVQVQPSRHQHAGFCLFFDRITAETGEQAWQTRVYHDESGEERVFSGTATAEWVDWILEQAKLATAVSERQPTADVEIQTIKPKGVRPYDAQVEIVDVNVAVVEGSTSTPPKNLVATIDFRITGVEAKALVDEGFPFQIEVQTVGLTNGGLSFVESQQSRLQPGTFDYTSQQELPIPELGRYEVRSKVLIFAPNELQAQYQGPVVNVIL